jgi:hypothetical protein
MQVCRKFSRIWPVSFMLMILLLQGSFYFNYGRERGQVVVVREADLRFGPVPLPLASETRDELMGYIKSGGDVLHTDPAPYYFKLKDFYTQLLDFLSSKDKIKVGDLFTKVKGLYRVNPRAGRWFKGPVILGVIDATQKRPAAERGFGPLAVSDGNLWWIFYRGNKEQLGLVLVTVPVTGQIATIPE